MPSIHLPPRLRALWPKGRALLCAVALAGYAAIAAAGGADLGRGALFFICAGLYLVLPGLALADRLGPQEPGLRIPLAMLYGMALLAATHCVAVRLGWLWLLRLLPAGVGLAWLALRLRRGWPARPASLPGNGVALWAALCLVSAVMMGALNPHPLAAGAADLSRDFLWNVGDATALSRAFPAQDLRFVGVRFSYHYLTELLVAALSLVSGASAYDIDAFFAAPLFLAGELAALWALGRQYYGPRHPRATRLLIVLLFGCQSLAMGAVSPAGDGVFGNTLLKHLLTNINAQATALILLCVFLTLFCAVSRRQFAVGWRHIAALLLSFALLTVAKGPQAGILLCSLAVTVLLLLPRRPRWGRALLVLGGAAAIFAAAYRILFAAGAGNSMVFSIFAMENSLPYRVLSPLTDRLCQALPFISGYVWLVGIGIVNAFCMLPFQFVLWASALPGAVRGLLRLDPTRILANGVAAGGFLAYHIFYHSSSSQVYFALVAMICMTLLAAEQLDRLLDKRPPAWRSVPLWLTGAAAAVTTVCIVAACTVQGAAQLGATLGWTPPVAGERAVTAADEQAAQWLAENSGPSLVFSTNRTSSSLKRDDGISNVYTALSGRQAYMEGWTYAVTNMGVDLGVIEHRLAVNERLFSPDLTPQELQGLCAEEGIGGVVYVKAWPGQMADWLVPGYENDEVAVYLF